MAENAKSSEELIAFVEELKSKWVATIDALVDPLMIVDLDYTISKANRSMAEFTEHEDIPDILGKKCYKIFANQDKPCDGCLMKKASETGKPCNFNLKDVRKKYFEVSSQPVYNSSGKLEGCVQVYRDRTEAKALQEQLVQSEKLASIGLLAGGIAHEINNPLGGILIFSQMLIKEMPEDSPFYSDVKEIEAATQRCKGIVERLLDFARAQPSDIHPKEKSPVDVTEALKSALRFAKVHSNARKTEISEDWAEEKFLVMGDRNNLIQLFLNLMQNAFQAMPGGGSLNLRSYKEMRSGVEMGIWEIEDSGIGIDPGHLPRIFDPFFTTKEPGEGTGLGLSICYGICQEAGGVLEAESKINIGTTFRVVLPLYHEQAKQGPKGVSSNP
ncbi:MAG: PAS domain-containing protein [Oligoflexales bacterium]|nr:PAS domain-containing protein [Oligoflexales bacterium]